MERYRKYIARATRTADELMQPRGQLEGTGTLQLWYAKYPPRTSDKTGKTLSTKATEKVCLRQFFNVDDWVDVEPRTIVLRVKPHATHDLQEKRRAAGEKVETYHSAAGEFANNNMNPLLAQMLSMLGTLRWNMDRLQHLDFHQGKTEHAVPPHYDVWLMLEANEVAARAGKRLPYPNLPALLPEDTGERFFYDYYLEQLEREERYEYTGDMKRCPCEPCAQRRLVCKCRACTRFRIETGLEKPSPVPSTIVESVSRVLSPGNGKRGGVPLYLRWVRLAHTFSRTSLVSLVAASYLTCAVCVACASQRCRPCPPPQRCRPARPPGPRSCFRRTRPARRLIRLRLARNRRGARPPALARQSGGGRKEPFSLRTAPAADTRSTSWKRRGRKRKGHSSGGVGAPITRKTAPGRFNSRQSGRRRGRSASKALPRGRGASMGRRVSNSRRSW